MNVDINKHCDTHWKQELYKSCGIESWRSQPVAIYGAGKFGKLLYSLLKEIGTEVKYVIDKHKRGTDSAFDDIDIISAEDIKHRHDDIPLLVTPYAICASEKSQEEFIHSFPEHVAKRIVFVDLSVSRAIEAMKSIDNQRVNEIYSLLEDVLSKYSYSEYIYSALEKRSFAPPFYPLDQQYLANDLYCLGEEDYIVDCGAFTGDTAELFCKHYPQIKGISAFEPTPETFLLLQKSVEAMPLPVQTLNIATGNKNGKCFFNTTEVASSNCLSEKGQGIEVAVARLDDVLKNIPTYIKMDVEGAELETLMGAEKTIKAHRPILAVCIYHKWEDLWEIPEYIKTLVPDYKLFVRKYDSSIYELVLYGIPPERFILN